MYTGILLGYNLTDATIMTNQFDEHMYNSTLKELIKYVCKFYVASGLSYTIFYSPLSAVTL